MGLSQNMGYGFLLLYVVQFLTFSTIRASTTECSEQQELQYLLSVVDIGVLSAGGCDSLLSLRPSQDCCDTAAELASNPCLQPVLDSFDINLPLVNFVMSTLAACRLEPGVGYIVTGCPDGVVTGEEQCDDGNAISGDGCSSYCFVEDGYDCFRDNNGTSICWQCEKECFLDGRNACDFPGGPCGDCMDGFEENNLGHCAVRKHVYYAAVTKRDDTDESSCYIHDVGASLEGTPIKSADPYLNMIRMWVPERAALGNNVSCSLMEAIRSAPEVYNAILVLEVFTPEIDASAVLLNGSQNTHVVLFSDVIHRPLLKANKTSMFSVSLHTGLYLQGLDLSGGTSARGSLVENYGVFFAKDCFVFDIHESQERQPVFTDETLGIVAASSSGYMAFEDVVFTGNTVRLIDNSLSKRFTHTAFDFIGVVYLSNVSFVDSYSEGKFIQFRFISELGSIRDLHFEGVESESSLLDILTPISIDGLYINNCVASEGLVVLSQTSEISNFVIDGDYVGDESGVILNYGNAFLRNGVMSHTQSYVDEGKAAVIVNRGYLFVENSIFSSNNIVLLASSYTAHIYNCVFRDNEAQAQLYSTVYNHGEMIIDGCTFEDASGELSIESENSIILRNTILPTNAAIEYVACQEILELPDGRLVWPCGFNANCTESAYSGVNCTCAPGHIGSPTVMCGPPAAVHVLPDTDVVGFVTKDDSSGSSVQLMGLLSDGLGTVTWQVDEETLPPWLDMFPRNGTFVNSDPCISELMNLYIRFDAGGIRANDTHHTTEVQIRTSSMYEWKSSFSSVFLSVQMYVEVLPSPVTSEVFRASECSIAGDSGICEVEAGGTVSVVVDLRDSSGYSLGVGGSGYFVVHPTQLTSIDYENGTHVVTFEAPQTHFEIAVSIFDEHILGSPLPYRVICSEGDEWDSDEAKCVEGGIKIPRTIIGIVVAVLFVLASAMVTVMRNKKLVFQVDFFHKEATTELMWIAIDIVDAGTDIGAYWSVSTADSLSSYAPWYLGAVCVAVLFCLASLWIRLRALQSILREETSVHPRSKYFVRPIPVTGVYGLTHVMDPEDLDTATRQLHRKFRAHVLSVIGLFVEDVPMQVLNTIMLCKSGSDFPVEVLVSTEVTCILIGVKLTKIARARQLRANIRRIELKAHQRKLVQTNPVNRRR